MQKDINWHNEIKKAGKIFLRGVGVFFRGFINVLVTFLFTVITSPTVQIASARLSNLKMNAFTARRTAYSLNTIRYR